MARMQRFLRAVILLLLLATLVFYPLLAPTPHRIDEDHFELITDGMTEAEVEGIFGVPAGSYDWARPKSEYLYLVALLEAQHLEVQFVLNERIAQHEPGMRLAVPTPRQTAQQTRNWIGRHGAFAVILDERGRVVNKRKGGSTEIVFPWRDWWGKVTGR